MIAGDAWCVVLICMHKAFVCGQGACIMNLSKWQIIIWHLLFGIPPKAMFGLIAPYGAYWNRMTWIVTFYNSIYHLFMRYTILNKASLLQNLLRLPTCGFRYSMTIHDYPYRKCDMLLRNYPGSLHCIGSNGHGRNLRVSSNNHHS